MFKTVRAEFSVVCVYVHAVASVMSDSCDPADCIANKAPLSRKFFRQEYWSGLPCPSPGDLPDPGIKSGSLMTLHWQVASLPLVLPGKPEFSVTCSQRHLTETDSEPDFYLQLYTPAHIDAIYIYTHTGAIELSALGL